MRMTAPRPPVEARERVAEQPGDLHLADAEAVADRRLRQIFLEAEPHDLTLPPRQRRHETGKHHAILGASEAVVEPSDVADERLAAVVGHARHVEGTPVDTKPGRHRLEHGRAIGLELSGDLIDGGLSSLRRRELAADTVDASRELLRVPRYAHRHV